MNVNKQAGFILMIFYVFFAVSGCSGKNTVRLQDAEQHSELKTESPVDSGKESLNSDGKSLTGDSADIVPVKTAVAVYVCGAVYHTGVYELPADARIDDAIKAAGGMTADARTDMLNLAQGIEDGQMIRVPYNGETEAIGQDMGQAPGEETESRININNADAAQLKTIPGIGDAKAESIIRYREEKGNFQSIEDIMKIEGIKDGVFQKIKDYICVK